MVGLEAVLQRADDRNSSGNSSLKQEIFLCSLGSFQNLFSVNCNQIFVCSYYILSGFQCCKNVSTGRLNSTDQLDHNINRRISFDICPVCCKNRWIFHLLRCFLKVTHQDLRDLYLTSKLGCHFLLLIFDNFIDSGSYCSKTKKGRIYDFFAHFLMSPFRFFQFLSELTPMLWQKTLFVKLRQRKEFQPAAENSGDQFLNHDLGPGFQFIQLTYHGRQTFQAAVLNL